MKRKKLLPVLAALAVIWWAGTVQAAGFNIYEASARATALGGAFTATADDGSAIFYNPAGLSFIPGTTLDLNVSPIFPNSKFTGASPPYPPDQVPTGETVSQTFPIPGLYMTHNTEQGVALGFGVYAPYGLGVEWSNPNEWVGRFSSYDVMLETIYMTPAFSFQILDNFSLAMGIDFVYQKIELNRMSFATPPPDFTITNVIDTNLKGTADLGVTPSLGLLFKPLEDLSLGLMYHHKVTLNYQDGEATLTNIAPEPLKDSIDALISTLGGSTNTVKTQLNLPYILSMAAAYKFFDRVQLEFDAVRFGWSEFQELDLTFVNDPTGLLSSTIPEKYEDVWQFRFGLDFDINEDWKAMGGLIFDNSPQPVTSMGPLLADADRLDLSLGLQWRHKKWRFTAAYMAVLFDERSTVQDGEVTFFAGSDRDEIATRYREAGTYNSVANILSLGVGYNF